MNGKIVELEKQCWENIGENEYYFNRDKFAELIIKACLKIIEPTEDSGDEWCVTLKGAAEEIKEHFGVEK